MSQSVSSSSKQNSVNVFLSSQSANTLISIKDENGAIARITTILSENNIGIRNIEVLNNRENNFGALRIVVRSCEERDLGYDIIKNLGYDIVKIN